MSRLAIETMTNLELLDLFSETAGELLVDILLDIDTVSGNAGLTGSSEFTSNNGYNSR